MARMIPASLAVDTRSGAERRLFPILRDELDDSFLADPERIADLRQLSEGLHELAAGPMDDVAEQLKNAQGILRAISSGENP